LEGGSASACVSERACCDSAQASPPLPILAGGWRWRSSYKLTGVSAAALTRVCERPSSRPRPSARPLRPSWRLFHWCSALALSGGEPLRAHFVCLTFGAWPMARQWCPRLPACSHALFGAARHSDRCRASASELAHSGHVIGSPPYRICVHTSRIN
jgi:hypothetical protein